MRVCNLRHSVLSWTAELLWIIVLKITGRKFTANPTPLTNSTWFCVARKITLFDDVITCRSLSITINPLSGDNDRLKTHKACSTRRCCIFKKNTYLSLLSSVSSVEVLKCCVTFLLIETIALFLVTSVRLHPNKYVFDVESPGLNSWRPPQKPSPQRRQTLNGVKFMSQLVFNPFCSPPFASSHTRLLGAQSSSVESLSILD